VIIADTEPAVTPTCTCSDREPCPIHIAGRRSLDTPVVRLLLVECRDELFRWSQLDNGQALISPEDTGAARELVGKIEEALGLAATARRVGRPNRGGGE